MSKTSEFVLNLLRLVAGVVFMPHGAQKLFGLFGGFGGEPGATVSLFSLMGLAGVLEFFGGVLLILGLFTRPVAFILSGQMAVAYFMVHAPRGFWPPMLNRGETPALLCFIFLFLAAAGGGKYSLDGFLRRRKEAKKEQESATAPRPEASTTPSPSP